MRDRPRRSNAMRASHALALPLRRRRAGARRRRRRHRRHVLSPARHRGADLRRARALGRPAARLFRRCCRSARRCIFGIGAYVSALVLHARCRRSGSPCWRPAAATLVGRDRRRADRQPRARRLFRADHLRPGPGRRQGRLQHPRAGRLRRHDRHPRGGYRLRAVLDLGRQPGRLLPARARDHHGGCTGSRPICIDTPFGRRADGAQGQRAARALPRLFGLAGAACSGLRAGRR